MFEIVPASLSPMEHDSLLLCLGVIALEAPEALLRLACSRFEVTKTKFIQSTRFFFFFFWSI